MTSVLMELGNLIVERLCSNTAKILSESKI